jgi:hypothetical protein
MVVVLFIIASGDGCLFSLTREVLCTSPPCPGTQSQWGNTFPNEMSGSSVTESLCFVGPRHLFFSVALAEQTHDFTPAQPSALPPRARLSARRPKVWPGTVTCKPLKHCQRPSAPSLFTFPPTPSLHPSVIAWSRGRHGLRAFHILF